MNTLTFNASDWSGETVTAFVKNDSINSESIIFRGEKFTTNHYWTGAFDGVDEFAVVELIHEGRLIASAIQDGKTWYASESEGDISRCDKDPVVALLQVAANII